MYNCVLFAIYDEYNIDIIGVLEIICQTNNEMVSKLSCTTKQSIRKQPNTRTYIVYTITLINPRVIVIIIMIQFQHFVAHFSTHLRNCLSEFFVIIGTTPPVIWTATKLKRLRVWKSDFLPGRQPPHSRVLLTFSTIISISSPSEI